MERSISKKLGTSVLFPVSLFAFSLGLPAASVLDVSPGDSLRAAVAEARQSGVRTIRLKGGVYPVRETLELDRRDDGLTIEAAPGETPVLDGGVRLTDGVRGADGLVTYDLEKAGVENPRRPFVPSGMGVNGTFDGMSSDQLSVYRAGVPLVDAREPDEDFTGVTEVLDKTNFIFRAEIPGAEALVGQKGLLTHGYFTWGWADYTLPIEIRRDAKGIVYDVGMTDELPSYSKTLHKNQPFRLMGSRLFVDTDGECFYDRENGTVTVRDVPGELIVSSCTKPFLCVTGTHGLKLSGLTFRHGCGTGIVSTGTVDFVLSNCRIEKFGRIGVDLQDATRARIERNVFRTFGSSGLVLNGGDRATLRRSDNLVCDNEMSDAGRVVHSGTHVLLVHGVGNTIIHNYFHDMPGAAVRLDGNDQTFASNIAERCVMEADDWGAVENCASPFFRGSRIFHNVFRDIGGASKWNTCGQCGVRFDDMVSGMHVYGNRFINASKGHFGGVQTNGGKEHVIENNLFVGGKAMFSVNAWTEEFWLERWKKIFDSGSLKFNPFAPVWSAAYGDLRRLKYEPRRHILRRNIMVGQGQYLMLWGAGRVEMTMERNAIVPEGTSLDEIVGRKEFAVRSEQTAYCEAATFDPLPDESLLGVRRRK